MGYMAWGYLGIPGEKLHCDQSNDSERRRKKVVCNDQVPQTEMGTISDSSIFWMNRYKAKSCERIDFHRKVYQ